MLGMDSSEGRPATTKARARSATRAAPGSGQPRVLVVEDERDLQELLRFNLERNGYAASTTSNGEQALKLVMADPPDLILLDLMLPGIDGLNVCRALKSDPKTRDVPVVMVTAKGEETDIVVGLELGADDYVTKPFSPRVLLARIHAVLRRHESLDSEAIEAHRVHYQGMVIDSDKHEVTVDDEAIDLTTTEFKLLRMLAGHAGRVYTRQQIIDQVRGRNVAVTDRSVDVQVVNLRRKLGRLGKQLQTVRGVGYRLKE